MTAQVAVVDPYLAVAEDAVKLDDKALARICPGDGKGLAVPTDAVLREKTSDSPVAMRIHIPVGYMLKRKGDGPVMRQLYRVPAFVVEVHADGGIGGITRFGKDIPDAIVKIPVRVRRMAQVEFPAFVKIESLTDYGLGKTGAPQEQGAKKQGTSHRIITLQVERKRYRARGVWTHHPYCIAALDHHLRIH